MCIAGAAVFALLVLSASGLVVFENRLVYYPDPVIHRTPESAGLAYSDVRFRAADGSLLEGWYVPSVAARAVVLVCHGNAGNISTRIPLLEGLHRLQLSTFIFDYAGYGHSSGRPSEQGTYLDAAAAWTWLAANVPGAGTSRLPIVVMGRSLGGPIGAYVASIHHPAALVLDSTFPSLRSLVRVRAPYLPARLLLRYRYDTLSFLREVECPILIVHSREDTIVPVVEGRKLFAAIRGPKEFLELRGPHVGGFRSDAARYEHALNRFLDRYLTHS